MKADDLTGRYSDVLIDRIRSCRYPSKELMDRAELTLADRDHAFEYADVLLDKFTSYPSLQLLDRIAGLISRIDMADRSAAAREG
jgi:hypothetical protein